MEIMIADKMRELIKISQSQLKKLLKDGGYKKNIFIYGKSGIGKSAIVDEYGEENNLKVLSFSLATEMPEAMGGIPHAQLSTEDKKEAVAYFTRLLDERLAPLFKTKGKGYVLFFDEMNQALPEVLNACYSICHPDPTKRNWCGHSLEYAQIIGAGNLSTGEDGTVYLNDIPTPLHNRFNIFEMISNKIDTKNYLKAKYKNIPQVSKYIDILLEENVPPRDIDGILEVIAYEMDALWVSSKIGEELTTKLFNIQKKVKSVDPAQALKACRETYRLFKENGRVLWAGDYIEDEKDLLDEFGAILTEEEIQSIVKEAE
jgi:hypothetical protein